MSIASTPILRTLACLLGSAVLLTGLPATAAESAAGTDARTRRDIYVPNSETLRPDEMRVIALGTGMPAISRSQAAASFLVQLGSGENFIFDMGTGSISNLVQLQLQWNTLDKVFLGHLHFDHMGDLDALLIVGVSHGRNNPLHVWGPSGKSPELGTAYAVARLVEAYNWELTSKRGLIPGTGYEPIVHEFDHRQTQVVYDGNGVRITAFPAIHVIDGPVSYSLEWNGLKFVFSSDTAPNKWFLENAQNADLLIHEAFPTVQQLIDFNRMKPESAWPVGTRVHTQPAAAGKVFAMLKPRMAVAYHFINGIGSGDEVRNEIRTTYDGPLSLAQDMMTWNVTKEYITVRQAVGQPLTWPSESKLHGAKIEPEKRTPISQWLDEGRLDLQDIDRGIFERLDPATQQQILERYPEAKKQLGLE